LASTKNFLKSFPLNFPVFFPTHQQLQILVFFYSHILHLYKSA